MTQLSKRVPIIYGASTNEPGVRVVAKNGNNIALRAQWYEDLGV